MPLIGFWLAEFIERIAGEVDGEQAGIIASKIVVWIAFGLLIFIGGSRTGGIAAKCG